MKSETSQLRVNQALLDAGGDFSTAAAALGVSEKTLHDRVSDDPVLRARWKLSPAPPSSIISRPEDIAIAEAVQREEAQIKALVSGVDAMRMSPRAQSLALSCQRFYKQNFSQVIQITGGGITKAFLEALEEVENINRRLDNLDVPEEQRIAYESILREDRRGLLDFIHKAAVKVDQSVLIQAKVAKILGEGTAAGKSPSKPGFSSLKKVTDV